MRGARLYVLLVVPFLLTPILLGLIGVEPTVGLSVSLLSLIGLGVVAMIRVRTLYQSTTKPRSIFFGMLVAAIEIKVAAGAWVGYLVAANLLAPTGLTLPVPGQPLRAIITGLVAIVVLLSPVYYAVTIELERRDAERELAEEREAVLRRLNGERP